MASVIWVDFVLKKNENYYLQVFFQKCKYVEKNLIRHITYDLDFFFSENSDEKWIKNNLKREGVHKNIDDVFFEN